MTLIELVVALSISSMLLLVIGGTISIAVQALPTKQDSSTAYLDHASRLSEMTTDFRYATSVISSSPTMIEFTVADRDADTFEEVIRYEWSGTPGDPLTRQYNGGTVANFIDSVENLNLQYVVAPGEITESAEQLLINQDATTTAGYTNYSINAGRLAAETFIPVLPAGTTEWKVNRVQLYLMSRGPADAVSAVDLTPVKGNGEPDETNALDTVLVQESGLTSGGGFIDINFNNGGNLDPTKRMAVLIRHASGSNYSVRIRDGWGGTLNPNTSEYYDWNTGSWTLYPPEDTYLRVYGTITAPADLLSYTNIKIQYGSDATDCVNASVPTLNKPAM